MPLVHCSLSPLFYHLVSSFACLSNPHRTPPTATVHRHRNTTMESPEHHPPHHQQPWVVKQLSQQSDILSTTLLSLTSPFLSLFTTYTPKSDNAVGAVGDVSPTAPAPALLVKKAVMGFIGAAYVGILLLTLLLFSVILGVCLVRLWLEEPVRIEENLYFDYTDVHPSAVLDFGFVEYDKVVKSVPVGHVCNVRLVVVMPESDYNREIGMFQVVAESLATNGDVITTSSHPCMLRFHSQPIRAMQTFLLSAPLVFGLRNEIQMLNIPLLKYKELYFPRTRAVKISLIPRAGAPFLPQLYEARLVVNTQLPWRKELVRNWKYTFYVWTSLYTYLTFLVILISRFRSILFPTMTTFSGYQRLADSDVLEDQAAAELPQVVGGRDRPTSDMLNRWRQSRNKRKAMLLGGGSEATSMSVTRDDDASVIDEEVGDSESINQ